jgi:hypothetical protein
MPREATDFPRVTILVLGRMFTELVPQSSNGVKGRTTPTDGETLHPGREISEHGWETRSMHYERAARFRRLKRD